MVERMVNPVNVNSLNGVGSEFFDIISNEATRKVYRGEVEQFLKFIGKPFLKGLSPYDIQKYRQSISHLKPSTQARKLIIVRQFVRYCLNEGYIENDPFKDVRIPNFNCPEPEVLTQEEAEALLRVPDRRTLQGKRDYAVLALMLSTGLRKSEVCNINIGDFTTKWNSTLLRIKRGKGNKSRTVKILPEVEEAIKNYLKTREDKIEPELPLFLTIGKQGKEPKRITGVAIDYMVHRCAKKALIKKNVTPHRLRHTCFTLELIGGANIKQIQVQAGHSSINTTQQYLHVLDNIRDSASDKNPLFRKNGSKFIL